jgi:hypothetical protein
MGRLADGLAPGYPRRIRLVSFPGKENVQRDNKR